MLRKFVAAMALSLSAVFSAGAASASTVDISGGVTTLTVTAPLGALGLNAAPIGTASANGNVFEFPISGGTIDGDAAIIEHDGVGVELFTDTGVSATVGDFVIDTVAAVIKGNVNGGASLIDLFDLDLANAGPNGIDVLIGENLAGALSAVFGAPDLTGAVFGTATTAPDVVPLPASALLLLGGLAGLAGLRRRKAVA